jgi:lipopolysaccharide transport system permease protein
VNPLGLLRHLWAHRSLIRQFTQREVLGRYRGSYLGTLWPFLTPLLMVLIFTFVFHVVFKARWGASGSESKLAFALTLLCGLVPFNVFSECMTRAPSLIVGNPNYVKKVVFPLEILPVAVVGAALVHGVITLLIAFVGVVLFLPHVTATVLYLPLVLIPLTLLTVGFSWFLASLGVFVRDIGLTVGLGMQALLFLTPIFYPLSALPDRAQSVLRLNPLAILVEDMRRVVIEGSAPDWPWFALLLLESLAVAQLGYLWFMKSKRTFGDVL